jgi:hypothetical protein
MEFALNQLNDPMQIFNGVFIGTTLINLYFCNHEKLRVNKIKTHGTNNQLVEEEIEFSSVNNRGITLFQPSPPLSPTSQTLRIDDEINLEAGLDNNDMTTSLLLRGTR